MTLPGWAVSRDDGSPAGRADWLAAHRAHDATLRHDVEAIRRRRLLRALAAWWWRSGWPGGGGAKGSVSGGDAAHTRWLASAGGGIVSAGSRLATLTASSRQPPCSLLPSLLFSLFAASDKRGGGCPIFFLLRYVVHPVLSLGPVVKLEVVATACFGLSHGQDPAETWMTPMSLLPLSPLRHLRPPASSS